MFPYKKGLMVWVAVGLTVVLTHFTEPAFPGDFVLVGEANNCSYPSVWMRFQFDITHLVSGSTKATLSFDLINDCSRLRGNCTASRAFFKADYSNYYAKFLYSGGNDTSHWRDVRLNVDGVEYVDQYRGYNNHLGCDCGQCSYLIGTSEQGSGQQHNIAGDTGPDATVYILSPRGPGTIQFKAAQYYVTENEGTATIAVSRLGDTEGEVGVSYSTSDGTATAGTDYTGVSGTLTWGDGDGADKTFTIPILTGDQIENDETVIVTLSNPTGGAKLGVNTAVVTIYDVPPLKVNRTAGCKRCPPTAGEPVDTSTGEFFTGPKMDIDLGGLIPLYFSRTYASRLHAEEEVQSSLGPNWMHNFDIQLKKTSLPSRKAIVVYGRGNLINFEQPAQQDQWFVRSTAEDTEETVYQLREGPNREYWFMDPNRNLVYRFYDAPSNLFGKLREIQDRNGNALTFTYDASGNLTQVTDGLGRTLAFTYDASGNLTRVSDGTRNLNYTYTNGVLTGFTDAMGNTTTYVYDSLNTLSGPLLTGIQLPLGNQHHTQTYDAQGRVVSQVDAYGNALTLQYNTPNPGVTTITDALGKSRTNKHVRDRVITESTNAAGKTTTITRDANDRPTAITNQLGDTSHITYDSETGKPASVTDVSGNTGNITYISQDQTFGPVSFRFRKMTRIDYPDGTNEQFAHDAKGNVTSQVDRAGNARSFTHDSKGQILTATNPLGGVTTYTYNNDGTLSSQKDSETGTVTYEYEFLRRPTKVIHPDGTTKQFAYDLKDRLVSETLENGNTASQTFDANGNVFARIDHSGRTTQSVYDLMDRNVEITDRLGKVSKTTYDALGHVSSWIDANGNTTGFGYNENGWQTQVIDGEGKIWRTEYDATGRETAQISPLGGTVRYERDKSGNRTKITDPLGNSINYTYDPMSRLSSATDPIGRQVQYSYNNLGLLSGLTQSAIGTSPSYGYNALGLVSRITDMRGKGWSFGYTPMGRSSSRRDPLWNETTFSYDQRGRRTGIVQPTGETQVATLDGEGNITEVTYSDGTSQTYTYDAIGRLTSTEGISLTYDGEGKVIDTIDGTVHFGAVYDDGGRLKEVKYDNNAFTVTYTYDRRSHLTRVTDNLTNTAIDLTYDDNRRPTATNRPSGVNTTYTYDQASRTARIQDGAIADQQYTYNAAGDITQIVQNLPLDPATLLDPQTDIFAYDGASQVNSSGYSHNARGMRISSPGHAFVWDASGELTGTGTATLEYNGNGALLKRGEGGVTVHYYYNAALGSNVMAERNEGTGQFVRYYVWTPDGNLLYMIDASDSKVYFYHFDHLGSTLFLTNSTGSVTDSYAYTPYGVVLGHNGTNPQPFTFLGQYGVRQEGEQGIYQTKARYYDAITARFLSRDPAWPQLAAWDGLSPYLYARANPVMYHDVTGRAPGVKAAVRSLLRGLGGEAIKKLGLWGGKNLGTNTVQYVIKTGITKAGAKAQLSELRDQMFAPIYQKADQLLAPYKGASSWEDAAKDFAGEFLDPANYFPYSWATIPGEIATEWSTVSNIVELTNILADSGKTTEQQIAAIAGLLRNASPSARSANAGGPSYEQRNRADRVVIRFALDRLLDIQKNERWYMEAICRAEKQGISSVDDFIEWLTEVTSLDQQEEHWLRLMWLERHAPAEVQKEK